MPSYCIHVAHGLEVMKVLKHFLNNVENQSIASTFRTKYPRVSNLSDGEPSSEWKKLFLAGLIFPDSAKQSEHIDAIHLDRMLHYPKNPDSYFKTPDLQQFLKEYPLNFNDPLYLGYALHLYLDIQYDALLNGIFTILESPTQKAAFMFHKNNKIIVLEEGEFWKKLYIDYTRLNPYYVNLYSFSITDFAEPNIIRPRKAEQIPWYQKLYQVMEQQVLLPANDIISQKKIEEQKSQTEFLTYEIIDALIQKAANDFFDVFLKSLIYRCCGISTASKPISPNSSIIFNKHSNKWSAEQIKLQFYETHWKMLIKAGCIASEEMDYFKEILAEIQDVTYSATDHRHKHEKITKILCILPILITILSALATSLPAFTEQDTMVKWIIFVLGSCSTLLSACLAALNEYDKKSAHRETWIRQRLFYSMLMNETEEFCEKIGKYSELSDRAAVKHYMNEIRLLRKKDYENFFSNMGYSNFEK